MIELLALITIATLIILIVLRSLHSRILRMLVVVYVSIAFMYYLWGYTIPELILTLTLCSVSIIGITSALQIAMNDSAIPILYLGIPRIGRVSAMLYRGLYLYIVLFVGSISIASLLSIFGISLFHRLGIVIVFSILISYVVKRMERGLWIVLTILMILIAFAYLTAPRTLLSDLRSLDEGLRFLDLVMGSVG